MAALEPLLCANDLLFLQEKLDHGRELEWQLLAPGRQGDCRDLNFGV